MVICTCHAAHVHVNVCAFACACACAHAGVVGSHLERLLGDGALHEHVAVRTQRREVRSAEGRQQRLVRVRVRGQGQGVGPGLGQGLGQGLG